MSKKKKSGSLIDLPEGCRCTEIAVSPSNWNERGASIKKDWFIWYRFYDPAFKDHPVYSKGKLCSYRGMNDQKTLSARRVITHDLLDIEWQRVVEEGWNPIRKVFMKTKAVDADYIIAPDTPLNKALQSAFDRISKNPDTEPDMKINIRSVLKYFKQAAVAAMQDSRPISEIKRRHIVMCWEQLERLKSAVWTDNLHNYYRAHITMLFQELYQVEAIEVIPMGSIPVRHIEKKQRETLTREQRQKIDQELRVKNYRLWLLIQIFFHSGARTTELLAVRACDVDLEAGQVRYTVKKGRKGTARTIHRPIKDIALNLWEQALIDAGPNDFIFSDGLTPGAKTIRREQISRRWKLWVKDKYEVTADFYSLKHSNATEVTEMAGNVAAAGLTGHTSTKMIDEVYDVRRQARADEAVKRVGNSFG